MSGETIKLYSPTILVSILSLLLSVVAFMGLLGIVFGDLDLGGVAQVATFPFLIVIDFIFSFFISSPEQFLKSIGVLQCGSIFGGFGFLCYTTSIATIVIIWLYPLFTFLLNWLVVRFLFKRSNR